MAPPADAPTIAFTCPLCRGDLDARADAYRCARCARIYPVVCGIPDFRLEPDPYIGIDEDREKGRALAAAGRGLSFEALVRHYYATTPDDPADLAERWTTRALAETAIVAEQLADAGLASPAAPLLDLGCSTGALLVAAAEGGTPIVGVDVAFRWLVVGAVRLREAGVAAHLVCANGEHLPFPPGSFSTITCLDTIEHLRDPAAALAEAWRVARPGASLICTANNRLAPVPEPNLHLWGVGYLPRRWQARYVAWRRRDLHPYRIVLRSSRELRAMIAGAGFTGIQEAAPPIRSPYAAGLVARALGVYDRLRRWKAMAGPLRLAGPRLRFLARRPASASATASNAPSP